MKGLRHLFYRFYYIKHLACILCWSDFSPPCRVIFTIVTSSFCLFVFFSHLQTKKGLVLEQTAAPQEAVGYTISQMWLLIEYCPRREVAEQPAARLNEGPNRAMIQEESEKLWPL